MSNRTTHNSLHQKAFATAAVFACVLALTGCVEKTPLAGTPLEAPIAKIERMLKGPVNKVGSLLGVFGGPTYDEAREAKAAERTPVLAGDSLVQDGYLTVGLQMNAASVPFVIDTGGGALSGIDVDLASAIASELGLKVSFVSVGSIDGGLAARECDIVMDASADAVSTSTVLGGYYETAAAFFRLGDTGVVTAAELNGKTVGLQAGSVSQSALGNTALNMTQKSFENLNEAFDALTMGEIDYVLCDAYPGAFLASNYPGVSMCGVLNAPAPIGIASSSKSDLQMAVKDALDTVMANGKFDVIRSRWLGGMESVTVDDVIKDIPAAQPAPAPAADENDEGQDGSTAGANAVTVGEDQGAEVYE